MLSLTRVEWDPKGGGTMYMGKEGDCCISAGFRRRSEHWERIGGTSIVCFVISPVTSA